MYSDGVFCVAFLNLLIKLRLTQMLNYLIVGSQLFHIGYTPYLEEDDFYISVLVVDKKYRNQGIGTFLLNEGILIAREKNCKNVVLDVDNEGKSDSKDVDLVHQILDKKIIKNKGGFGTYKNESGFFHKQMIHFDCRGTKARWFFRAPCTMHRILCPCPSPQILLIFAPRFLSLPSIFS